MSKIISWLIRYEINDEIKEIKQAGETAEDAWLNFEFEWEDTIGSPVPEIVSIRVAE